MCVFQIYDVLVVFEIQRRFLGAVFGVGPCPQIEMNRRWYDVDAADMAQHHLLAICTKDLSKVPS